MWFSEGGWFAATESRLAKGAGRFGDGRRMVQAEQRATDWFTRGWLAVIAVGCVWPVVVCATEFRALFLFQDEWDQLRELEQMGWWRWALSVFGENFMPVGKMVWGGTLLATGGSHFAVIVAMWVTHLMNVFLLGWLMVERGCGRWAAAFAAVVFGYSASTIETLAWGIQWTNVMALTFFLLALLQLEGLANGTRKGVAAHAWFALAVAASGFSFVRGMLAGLAITAFMMWPWGMTIAPARRWRIAVLAALPAIVALGFMKAGAIGSVQHTREFGVATLLQMGEFAARCYAGNPFAKWIDPSNPGGGAMWIFAGIKTAVLVCGVRWAAPRFRPLLVVLVLFELANVAALGVGRYWTGMEAATSSRYQYTSLFALAPFLGVVVERVMGTLKGPRFVREAIAAVALLGAGFTVTRSWPSGIEGWHSWRGAELRAALALPAEEAPAEMPRHPWLSHAELRRLVEKYGLH